MNMDFLSMILALLIALCTFLYAVRYANRDATKRYFPGPPSEPLFGHLRILPGSSPWVAFTDWGKIYGGRILHISIFNKPVIILNSAEDARNLLEKRSFNYSDRPISILQGELGGIKYFTGFIRYGEDYKVLRHFTTQFFNENDQASLNAIITDEVRVFLKKLLDFPENFRGHIDSLAAGALVKSTYGYEALPTAEEYVKLATDASTAVMELGVTGMNLVDVFPVARYLPAWCPGLSCLKKAKETKKLMDRMLDWPYERVKSLRKTGVIGSSFVDQLLADYEKRGEVDLKHEVLMKNAAGQLFGAAVETTTILLQTFFLMMLLHPEFAKKAQQQIESVVGSEQLPTLRDRQDLPYIDCILKETMRINVPGPLGIPHASIAEDVYKDRIIPAGSIIISNIWSMMRDEQYFPDADTFDPDRFLEMVNSPKSSNTQDLKSFNPSDPTSLIFGFGRRICPGRFLADAEAWLVVANVLATFDILPDLDEKTEKEMKPKLEWLPGMTSKLKPFRARIVPRSKKHAQLVKQE